MDHQVIHNEAKKRFEVDVPNGPAVAAYEREGDVITFTHTVVPEEAEGQGIAAAMVREALAYARQARLRVVAQCPYVAAFVKKHHSEYADLVENPGEA